MATSTLDLTGHDDFETIGQGGGFVDEAGWYHAEITAADEVAEQGKQPCIKFMFTILAAKSQVQVGRGLSDRLYLTEKTRDRQALYAKRLKLITPAHVGKTVEINWDAALNKQVILNVVKDEYKKDGETKSSYKVAFDGIYDLADPKVKDAPRDSQRAGDFPWSGTKASGPVSNLAPVKSGADVSDF